MSLVDTVGSLAIASRGHQMTGVSVGELGLNTPTVFAHRHKLKIYRRLS
jgi:hypothetical protein